MTRQVFYDDAITTSMIRYGESDCIVRLFCRSKGRVSAFVKNGLKPSKSRGGTLQIPSIAKVGLRFTENQELAKLVQYDVLPSTHNLSSSLKGFGWACYLVELVELFLHEEPAPEVFEDLQQALLLIGQQKACASMLRAFELRLLQHCGYLPDLANAVDSPSARVVAFDYKEGHLLAHMHEGTLPFSEEARMAAIRLLHSSMNDVPEIPEDVLKMVSLIFVSRLREHVGKPLKSVEFLKSIGV